MTTFSKTFVCVTVLLSIAFSYGLTPKSVRPLEKPLRCRACHAVTKEIIQRIEAHRFRTNFRKKSFPCLQIVGGEAKDKTFQAGHALSPAQLACWGGPPTCDYDNVSPLNRTIPQVGHRMQKNQNWQKAPHSNKPWAYQPLVSQTSYLTQCETLESCSIRLNDTDCFKWYYGEIRSC